MEGVVVVEDSQPYDSQDAGQQKHQDGKPGRHPARMATRQSRLLRGCCIMARDHPQLATRPESWKRRNQKHRKDCQFWIDGVSIPGRWRSDVVNQWIKDHQRGEEKSAVHAPLNRSE